MATLKISDLSVGDWVALECADLKIEHGDIATAFVEEVRKPIRVQSILGEDKLVFARAYHLEGFGTIYAKEEHLRPIPITAEILEANGWKKGQRGEFYHYLRLDKNSTLYVHASTNGWRVEITYDAAGILRTTHLMPDMNSVHDLQHALRLAGVDKEINL